MTHNRPVLAVNAIESILNQSEKDFKLVVSDNSSNKELQEIMEARFPQVEHKSWFPGMPLAEHFKKVISLVDTAYFVMFHDDDLMEPDYVKRILEEFKKEPHAAAIATNAWKIDKDGEKIQDSKFFVSKNKIETIVTESDLLCRYLAGNFGGVSPFSSYAYNTDLIKGLFPDYVRWKNYCDTLFLVDVGGRGPIIWINDPLVRVRVYENNVSAESGVRDYKLFIKQVQKRFGSIIKRRYIEEYHFLRLFFALKKNGKRPLPAIKYLIFLFPKLMISSHSFRKRILKKVFS
jgi:glycosyltransferase involved in cell wall biosynthesis